MSLPYSSPWRLERPPVDTPLPIASPRSELLIQQEGTGRGHYANWGERQCVTMKDDGVTLLGRKDFGILCGMGLPGSLIGG